MPSKLAGRVETYCPALVDGSRWKISVAAVRVVRVEVPGMDCIAGHAAVDHFTKARYLVIGKPNRVAGFGRGAAPACQTPTLTCAGPFSKRPITVAAAKPSARNASSTSSTLSG